MLKKKKVGVGSHTLWSKNNKSPPAQRIMRPPKESDTEPMESKTNFPSKQMWHCITTAETRKKSQVSEIGVLSERVSELESMVELLENLISKKDATFEYKLTTTASKKKMEKKITCVVQNTLTC